MRYSFLHRWKFSDSRGQPRSPGALLCGCAGHSWFVCDRAIRRKFLAGVATAGVGGLTNIFDPVEAFTSAQFPSSSTID